MPASTFGFAASPTSSPLISMLMKAATVASSMPMRIEAIASAWSQPRNCTHASATSAISSPVTAATSSSSTVNSAASLEARRAASQPRGPRRESNVVIAL